MTLNEKIINKIKAYRDENEVSQSQFGKILGTRQQHIYAVENSKVMLSTKYLNKLISKEAGYNLGEKIGEELKKYRKKNHLTKKELGEMIGIMDVNNIEKNKNNITIAKLEKLGKILDLDEILFKYFLKF